MPKEAPDETLLSALRRARTRWLNAAAVNAGGPLAVLPALACLLVALVWSLLDKPGLPALAALSTLAAAGILATLGLTRRAFAQPRRPGAPDWSLALDRALKLDDALVTMLDGPGPFAGVLARQVRQRFDESLARAAAPRRRFGPLAVALLLALAPLALWQPQRENAPGTDEVASQPPLPRPAGAPDGVKDGAPQPKAEEARRGPPKTGGGSGEGEGDQEAPGQPSEKGRKSERPGEAPPKDAQPQPSNSTGTPPKSGDNNSQAQPQADDPKAKVDAKDVPITPDAGEGERRAEERRKWVYNPDGQPAPGAEASEPNWKARAEDVIPRMKLTGRERKVLEDWFRKLGTR